LKNSEGFVVFLFLFLLFLRICQLASQSTDNEMNVKVLLASTLSCDAVFLCRVEFACCVTNRWVLASSGPRREFPSIYRSLPMFIVQSWACIEKDTVAFPRQKKENELPITKLPPDFTWPPFPIILAFKYFPVHSMEQCVWTCCLFDSDS